MNFIQKITQNIGMIIGLALFMPAITLAQVQQKHRGYDSEEEIDIAQQLSDGSTILLTTAHSIKIVAIAAVISTFCFLGYFLWLKTVMPDDLEKYNRARRWIFYNIAVVTVLVFATMILHLFNSV